MSRNEMVRREALRLDRNRCQLCGKNEDLNAHHIRPLGMGGSEERDTVENMITLCAECHGKVHNGQLHIERWVRPYDDSLPIDARSSTDEENGLIVERREGIADEWKSWPKSELWFYRRQDAEALEKEIEMVRQVQLVESKHAQIMAHIWENYSLLSDAVSPEQFVAGLGLDSNQAKKEAKAAKWIEDKGLIWPNGVNVRKVLLISSVTPERAMWLVEAQGWLARAADMSYSDLRKALIAKGLKLASWRWYLIIGEYRRPLGRVQADTLFVRSRDYEVVLSWLAPGGQSHRNQCLPSRDNLGPAKRKSCMMERGGRSLLRRGKRRNDGGLRVLVLAGRSTKSTGLLAAWSSHSVYWSLGARRSVPMLALWKSFVQKLRRRRKL